MKELRLLEGWADEIINEFKRDRDDVLPIEQDPIKQVQRKYPQLSDTEAASKFIHDITKDFVDQTAVIDAQRKENERLKKSVADISREIGQIEQDGENTQRELDRLRQLSGQIRGEVQSKRVSQGEIDEILNQARESLRGKTGISDEQYQEVVKKINDMKDGIVDPKKFQEVKASVEALAGQAKIDPREFEKLRGEIQRATTDRDEISRMMTQFQELKNKPGLDPKQYDALKSELESKIAGLQAGRIEPAAFDALKKQLDALDGETKVKSVDIDRVQKLLDQIEARQYDTKQKEMSVDAKFAELERKQAELFNREQKLDDENKKLNQDLLDKEQKFQEYKGILKIFAPDQKAAQKFINLPDKVVAGDAAQFTKLSGIASWLDHKKADRPEYDMHAKVAKGFDESINHKHKMIKESDSTKFESEIEQMIDEILGSQYNKYLK